MDTLLNKERLSAEQNLVSKDSNQFSLYLFNLIFRSGIYFNAVRQLGNHFVMKKTLI